MTCATIRRRLASGRPDAPGAAAHLAACPACRRFAARLTTAGRASMVCLAEPLTIPLGKRVELTLKEVTEGGGARFQVPVHAVRQVF